MSKGKDLAATGNKGHLRHKNYASYKLAFILVTKSRFAPLAVLESFIRDDVGKICEEGD